MLKSTRVIAGALRGLRPLHMGTIRTGGLRSVLSRGFASTKKPDLDEIVIEADAVSRSDTATYEFQAETRKLLNIVAKSIYTDSEVFLRELLSNASDALEKQKFKSFEDANQEEGDPLQVTVITNEAKRQLTIFDTGVGMSKQELIENLGTIAKSGSKSFVDKLKDSGKPNADIIGQFGVGFYSSFIVGHTIEVISKQAGKDAHIWVSDGSGQFSVSKAENVNFDRGTKIVIHLNPDHLQFCRKLEVEQIIKKYSNFINYPIFLNGEKVNITAPIWTRDKGSVQEMEYRALYEHLSKSKLPYKYKLHFAAEVPIQMKAVLYIPTTHSEKQGQGREEPSVALYSRKVLIKDRCAELLPSYLRFVKGVVDCEDLPLNISRENYQDSALITKIRGILTKRILKMLHDEMARDPTAYKEWVRDFTTFFGEGFLSDKENSEFLIKLLRFKSSFSEDITIDDYVASAKPGQTNIYFTVAGDLQTAMKNPFMEGFVQSKTPVLLLQSKIEEIFVSQLEKYKGFKVVSIESNYEDIQKDIGVTSSNEGSGLSEEEISGFCIWVKVKVSKRLTKDPAIIISQVPSSMKAYIQLMEPAQLEALKSNHTMEVNPNHKLINHQNHLWMIVALNRLRKQDLSAANIQLRYLLDNTLLASGLLIETSEFVHKTNNFMESRINTILEQKQLKEATAKAERPITGKAKESTKEALLKEVYGEMRNDLRENMKEAQTASQDKK